MQEYQWLYGNPPPIEERKYDANAKIIIEDDVKVLPDKCEELLNGKYLAYMLITKYNVCGEIIPRWISSCTGYYYFVLYHDISLIEKWRILRHKFPPDICWIIFNKADENFKIRYYCDVKRCYNCSSFVYLIVHRDKITTPLHIHNFKEYSMFSDEYDKLREKFLDNDIKLPPNPSLYDMIDYLEPKYHNFIIWRKTI